MNNAADEPSVFLGIDAAWTENGSTGVAVIARSGGRARLVAAEPSYGEFVHKAFGESVKRGLPDAAALVGAAHKLAGAEPNVIAVDMPMSKVEFSARREADRQISEAFGSLKAGTHSPSRERPGALGRHITEGFGNLGFALATKGSHPSSHALVEVYPHTALIRLMRCDERRKYKAQKSTKYWKGRTVVERIDLLLREWHLIVTALSIEIDGMSLNLPERFLSLSSMKAHEDRLDAVVSAWAGMKFFMGEAEPFGDANAAIWVPL
jgi:predicted RNase H-like nuclease